MAKRYIDTNFFKSPFVRSLPSHLKTFYCFVICDAQGSGIWTVDTEIASVYIGSNITIDEVEKYFLMCGKAIDLKNGRWFFPDFIQHQYPSGLNRGNKAHKNFIAELDHYGLIDEDCNLLLSNNEIHEAPSKGPLRESIEESQRVKEGSLEGSTGNGNSNSNCNSKGNSSGNKGTLQPKTQFEIDVGPKQMKALRKTKHPISDDYTPALRLWLKYKKERGSPYAQTGIDQLLKTWSEMTPDRVMTAVEQCIQSNYQGLFYDKINDDGTIKTLHAVQRKSTAGFSDKTIEQARGWANS